MITTQARHAFDEIFVRALGKSLSAPGEPPCRIRAIGEAVRASHDKVVLLTICSYGFRLLTLLHFNLDAPTRAHLARCDSVEAPFDDDAALDSIAELGNILCGTFNRSLGAIFPHTGMSTPNVLHARSAEFLSALGAAHLQRFEVCIEGGPTWHASLCVCTNTDIDFSVPELLADVEAAEATGELEMF